MHNHALQDHVLRGLPHELYRVRCTFLALVKDSSSVVEGAAPGFQLSNALAESLQAVQLLLQGLGCIIVLRHDSLSLALIQLPQPAAVRIQDLYIRP